MTVGCERRNSRRLRRFVDPPALCPRAIKSMESVVSVDQQFRAQPSSSQMSTNPTVGTGPFNLSSKGLRHGVRQLTMTARLAIEHNSRHHLLGSRVTIPPSISHCKPGCSCQEIRRKFSQSGTTGRGDQSASPPGHVRNRKRKDHTARSANPSRQ